MLRRCKRGFRNNKLMQNFDLNVVMEREESEEQGVNKEIKACSLEQSLSREADGCLSI
jgi:hypothetical protein